MQTLASTQLLLGVLQRQKQRKGVEFAIGGKARQGQHQNIVWAQPQIGPQRVARRLAGGEGGAVDAQGDDRHLRAWRGLAKACAGIVIDQRHLMLHRGMHRARGANQPIPWLQGGGAQLKHAVHHGLCGGGMGDAAQAVARIAQRVAAPQFRGKIGRGETNHTRRTQPLGIGPVDQLDGGVGRMICRRLFERLSAGFVLDDGIKPVCIGMAQKPLQKRGTGHAAPVDAMGGGAVAIFGIPDGGIGQISCWHGPASIAMGLGCCAIPKVPANGPDLKACPSIVAGPRAANPDGFS